MPDTLAAQRITAVSRRPASLGAVPAGTVSLAMGEPSGDTAPAVVEAAVDALRRGRTRYAPLTGAPALREALAERLGVRHLRHLSAREVVLTHGASAGLAAVILALVRPGDRVVVPEPTYSLYADQVALAGGVVDWVPNRSDGSLDLGRIAAALPGARLVVLCNPSNPTGVVHPGEDVRALADLARRHDCYLLSDEAYADIVFDAIRFVSALDLDAGDHVICCGTFSKSYAMTGWRLGWVVAPRLVADAVNLVHRTINGALSTFVQHAALTALDTPDVDLRAAADGYQRRRDRVVAALRDVPGVRLAVPQGAFYAFPAVDAPVTSDELTARCTRAGVLVRSGREYGPSGEGHLRISFAAGDAELDEGLRRLTGVLTALTDPGSTP